MMSPIVSRLMFTYVLAIDVTKSIRDKAEDCIKIS